jgi:thymidylate synthase
MKKYLDKLIEELLQGQIKSSWGPEKALIYKIESKEEFDLLDDGCRGIIFKNSLYMTNNSSILHSDLKEWLKKAHYLSSNISYFDGWSNFNKCLTVVKKTSHLMLGESVKDARSRSQEEKDQIEKLFNSIKHLHIPYMVKK